MSPRFIKDPRDPDGMVWEWAMRYELAAGVADDTVVRFVTEEPDGEVFGAWVPEWIDGKPVDHQFCFFDTEEEAREAIRDA